MRHSIVSGEFGKFCGWPANNGGWQWGNEILIGFLRGKYGRASLHNVVGKLEVVHARTLDGGETWAEEHPGIEFDFITPSPPPAFDLSTSIIRVCGGYDHGGDECPQQGAFYLSQDRGRKWSGPYEFTGLEADFSGKFMNTSRTAVIGTKVFLSSREVASWGSDWGVVAEHDGQRFIKVGEIEANARVVMPSPVHIAGEYFVVAVRRRGPARLGGWIDAFESYDGGRKWSHLSLISETGSNNGNPPSLIKRKNGALVCAYANRSDKQLCVRESRDCGITWSNKVVIRESKFSDIGYPRLFEREDKKLLLCYYFADEERPHQYIAATVFGL